MVLTVDSAVCSRLKYTNCRSINNLLRLVEYVVVDCYGLH